MIKFDPPAKAETDIEECPNEIITSEGFPISPGALIRTVFDQADILHWGDTNHNSNNIYKLALSKEATQAYLECGVTKFLCEFTRREMKLLEEHAAGAIDFNTFSSTIVPELKETIKAYGVNSLSEFSPNWDRLNTLMSHGIEVVGIDPQSEYKKQILKAIMNSNPFIGTSELRDRLKKDSGVAEDIQSLRTYEGEKFVLLYGDLHGGNPHDGWPEDFRGKTIKVSVFPSRRDITDAAGIRDSFNEASLFLDRANPYLFKSETDLAYNIEEGRVYFTTRTNPTLKAAVIAASEMEHPLPQPATPAAQAPFAMPGVK